MMHILIVGCGYVGERFAEAALQRGWQISVLTRSLKRTEQLSQQGIIPYVGDVLVPKSLELLPPADLCLYAVGYDRTARVEKREVYVSGLRNVLTKVAPQAGRLIYLSSTSVYGESTGQRVNEESNPAPSSESGQICLDAEQVVTEFAEGRGETRLPATIVRLAGIYGPGRLIGRKQQLQEQQPISGNPQAWLNLIHVEDIVQSLFALAESPVETPRFLLSDEQPIRRIDFYTELARLLETAPPLMPDSPSDDLGKRCDSSLIRQMLGIKLKYPTIYEGLPASLTEANGDSTCGT